MNDAEKRRLLNSLTNVQAEECARRIVNAGTTGYPFETFAEIFGNEAEVLVGIGYANRLAPALKRMGFAISLKMFPGNRRGCSVHPIWIRQQYSWVKLWDFLIS